RLYPCRPRHPSRSRNPRPSVHRRPPDSLHPLLEGPDIADGVFVAEIRVALVGLHRPRKVEKLPLLVERFRAVHATAAIGRTAVETAPDRIDRTLRVLGGSGARRRLRPLRGPRGVRREAPGCRAAAPATPPARAAGCRARRRRRAP